MADSVDRQPDRNDANADMMGQVRKARKKFLAMASTYSLGAFNDNFFKLAAMTIAVDMGKDAYQGWATILFTLPFILFAAPAGWLADRFSKRNVIVGAKLLELVAMIAGSLGLYFTHWPLIFIMLFIMAAQSAIFSPALNGSIPELYPPAFVPTANARVRVAVNIMIILGMASATGLLGLSQGKNLVAIGVVLIALIGVLISFGAPRFPAANPTLKCPRTGPYDTVGKLWGLRRDRMLTTTILANSFIWFIAVLLSQVIMVLGLNQMGISKPMTGVLLVALLVGIGIGGLLSARLSRQGVWFRMVVPATFLLSLCLALLFFIPVLPKHLPLLPACFPWFSACFTLFLCLGIAGGIYMIPTESFIQIRPAPQDKGSVWAAANFASFSGMAVAGGVYLIFTSLALRPTDCLGIMAIMTFLWAFFLQARFYRGNWFTTFLSQILFQIIKLRYRVSFHGVDPILDRGHRGILVLPNHPAFIDPPIIVTGLYPMLQLRPLADEDQMNRPLISWFSRRLGTLPIPDISKVGQQGQARIENALSEIADALNQGENVLLYPSGGVLRQWREEVGGNSAVETILAKAPRARIVLVQTRGLWGSSFSWSGGQEPRVVPILLKGLWRLLVSGVFFIPRRKVDIRLSEPDDFPRGADRKTINSYLENHYNQAAVPNTYVPFTPWERGAPRVVPEPERAAITGDLDDVPDSVRRTVLDHLAETTGHSKIRGEERLAHDLGMDSLARAELLLWLGSEFGGVQTEPEAFQTVNDVLLAASGQTISTGKAALKPVPKSWFASAHPDAPLPIVEGHTIPEVFLRQAAAHPGRIIAADQTSGAKTYRDLVMGILVLKRRIEKMPGDYVGIMLPASIAATTTYLAALFAGKTPVMINWTVGPRVMRHAMDLFRIKTIITSELLIQRLEKSGTAFPDMKQVFFYLEGLRKDLSLREKMSALLKSRLSWRSLRRANVQDNAVILFTSGSESLPKAVPLTHTNLLSNLRVLLADHITLKQGDRLMGMLPPFHSLGLLANVALPVIHGLPITYHPNPTEGPMLAQFIEAYRTTLIAGTPTFLNSIMKAARPGQLATLRVAVTGAEKCPDHVYQALDDACPGIRVLEGYGITECSPVVSLNKEKDPRPGTVGPVLKNLEYVLVDPETGEQVPRGQRGMMLVRGPSIFKGYLHYDGPSPFVTFRGKSWYKTGDLITEDSMGILSFSGRLKRFVKIGGEMISLPAIETVLLQHFAGPAGETEKESDGPILAVESIGEESHPDLVLVTTQATSREAANRIIREAGLSALHNIRHVRKVDEIPILGTGKTNYRAVKAMLAESESADQPTGD